MNYSDEIFEDISKEDLTTFMQSAKALLKYVSKPGRKENGDAVLTARGSTLEMDIDYGICRLVNDGMYHIKSFDVDPDDILRYCFERWEHFTGRYSYPVPVTSDVESDEDDDENDPEYVFDNINHWEGEQLAMREDLLNFIVKTVKPFIEKAE